MRSHSQKDCIMLICRFVCLRKLCFSPYSLQKSIFIICFHKKVHIFAESYHSVTYGVIFSLPVTYGLTDTLRSIPQRFSSRINVINYQTICFIKLIVLKAFQIGTGYFQR